MCVKVQVLGCFFFVLGLVHCWTHKTFQVDIKNKLIKEIGSDEKKTNNLMETILHSVWKWRIHKVSKLSGMEEQERKGNRK